jgi:hypothetical protein
VLFPLFSEKQNLHLVGFQDCNDCRAAVAFIVQQLHPSKRSYRHNEILIILLLYIHSKAVGADWTTALWCIAASAACGKSIAE